MTDTKNKNLTIIWLTVMILFVILIIGAIALPDLSFWLYMVLPFLIVVGVIVTLTMNFFFDPKKTCPRCDAPVHSMYTERCSKCGLKLIVRCPECRKFLNSYAFGKPIKFCNDCGTKLKEKVEKIQVTTLQNVLAQSDKAIFCPGCGSSLEEERNPKFCPLCGIKID